MEIRDIVAVRRRILLVVNVEVLAVRRIAFVDELNAGGAVKRHLQIAIKRATNVKRVVLSCRRGERNRVIRVDDFVAEPEEVTQRAQHTRMLLIVPEHLNQHVPIAVRLRHPNVVDTAGALDIGEHARFAGRDVPCIVIASRGIPRGSASRARIFHTRQR